MTDDEVLVLAKKLAAQATASWNMLSTSVKAEIIESWRVWLQVNLPASTAEPYEPEPNSTMGGWDG